MIPEYDSWTIVREIGSGSYGTVYEIQKKDFDYIYKSALKVISVPQKSDEVEQLRRNQSMTQEELEIYFNGIASDIVKEFEIMSKLKGITNIVSYQRHEIKKHEDGIGCDIYIEMELLTPLDQYMKDHTLTGRDVIQLGIDMCTALERCQKFRIIHRDIKPANIFISEQGDFKLGDFGIAKVLEKHTALDLSKKGTYNYMAPEVYRGEDYNFSVDLYSLGIVLYKLLNFNRIPFMPNYPAKQTRDDMAHALARRMRGDKLPYPAQDHSRLADIILKACSFDARMRYSSPTDMKTDLEAILYRAKELDYVAGISDHLVTPNENTPSGNPSDVSGHSNVRYPTKILPLPKKNLQESLEEATVLLSKDSDDRFKRWIQFGIGLILVLLLIIGSNFFFIEWNKTDKISDVSDGSTISDQSELAFNGELSEEEIKVEKEEGDAGYTIEKQYRGSNLIKETQYHADGTLGFTYKYAYDNHGNQISETIYRPTGEIWKKYVKEYDKEDFLQKQSNYEEGELINYTLHTWNQDGTESGYTIYSPDDQVTEEHIYTYQDNGTYTETVIAGPNITLAESINIDGETIDIKKVIYHYDISGQKVKQSDYDKDGLLVNYCEIKYDYQFRQTQQSWYYADGTVEGHVEYEYSDDGSTTEQILYDANGDILRYIENEQGPDGKLTITQYDKERSIVAQEVYDEEGNSVQRDEYGLLSEN